MIRNKIASDEFPNLTCWVSYPVIVGKLSLHGIPFALAKVAKCALLNLVATDDMDYPCSNERDYGDNVCDDDLANGLIATAN